MFREGVDAKASAVDGTKRGDKKLWCPFMSGQMIPKNCDREKCRLWAVVKNPKDKRIIKSGCRFEIGSDAMIALALVLEGRE